MKYTKPNFEVTEFEVNEKIAADCQRLVTGTETTKVYDKQEVECIIGAQDETVFNTISGCSTAATTWGVTEYNGTMYFVWYTHAGDTGNNKNPDKDMTNFLDMLVGQIGGTTGSGWHYAEVTSRDLITDVLDFSY